MCMEFRAKLLLASQGLPSSWQDKNKVVYDYVLKINSTNNTFSKCFGKVEPDGYELLWSLTFKRKKMSWI